MDKYEKLEREILEVRMELYIVVIAFAVYVDALWLMFICLLPLIYTFIRWWKSYNKNKSK